MSFLSATISMLIFFESTHILQALANHSTTNLNNSWFCLYDAELKTLSMISEFGNASTDERIDELNLAIKFQPPYDWGKRFVTQKSIRVICFGGSNTDNGAYPKKLELALKRYYSNESYVINAGLSAYGPGEAQENLYMFPQNSKNVLEWPNLVTFEFATNCEMDINCAERSENLLMSIKHIYRSNQIPLPYFLFLDFNRWYRLLFFYDNQGDVSKIPSDSETRKELLYQLQHNESYYHGNPYFESVPHYYNYPLISISNATAGAYFRQYLRQSTYNQTPKWGLDVSHINHGGSAFVAWKIMIPFLYAVLMMNKHHTTKSSSQLSFDHHHHLNQQHHYSNQTKTALKSLPMFEHERLYSESLPISQFTSWSNNRHINTLQYIVSSSRPDDSSWGFVSTKKHLKDYNKNDEDHPLTQTHICFGSSILGTVGRFNVFVPNDKCGFGHENKNPKFCTMSINYIYSWNTSHFGNSTCRLYTHKTTETDSNSISQEKNLFNNTKVFIAGNYNPDTNTTMKHTLPKKVIISKYVIGGNYSLECDVANAGHLACISRLVVN